MTLQNDDFFVFRQLTRLPLTEPFHLSSLLHVPNDRRMVSGSSSATSCLGVRGSAPVTALSRSLAASGGRPLHLFLVLKALISLLNHHCPARSLAAPVPAVTDVASRLHCFTTHFELK